MKRFILCLLLTTSILTLSACAYTSYRLPENAISLSIYLSTIQTTSDHVFWSDTGKYSIGTVIYSPKGICEIIDGDDDCNYKVSVNGVETICDFKSAMGLLNPDWIELCGEYDETVLTEADIKALVETVELNADNYRDYVGFDEISTKNEITGYDADYRKKYRPYDYMINTYVGPGTLLTDYCSKISCSGTVDRKVTINIYDFDYRLCSTETDSEATGKGIEFNNSYSAVYLGDEDSYTIHFTPYMDPLESWYIKTFSNGLKEIHQTLVEISNINITDASGTLVIYNEPGDEMWSTDPSGKKYIAIEIDGTIKRIYEDEKQVLMEMVLAFFIRFLSSQNFLFLYTILQPMGINSVVNSLLHTRVIIPVRGIVHGM